MGWAVGWDYRLRRDVGYGVPAICDDPSCDAKIDRGLSYCCGQEPFGGEKGCGLHFCGSHLWSARATLVCRRCKSYRPPYKPKPDTAEWIEHKLTDPTWAEWRDDNPEWVAEHAPKIEARRAETQSGSVEDESLVPAGQAPDPLTPDTPAPKD